MSIIFLFLGQFRDFLLHPKHRRKMGYLRNHIIDYELMDYICKLESIYNDLCRVAEILKIPRYLKIPNPNIPHTNKMKYSVDYKAYYDHSDLIDIVSEGYRSDIEKFNYTFDSKN